MWWIFCESHDLAARWAYDGLRRHGLASLQLATAPQLANARRWVHRLGEGVAKVEIELADGRRFASGETRGVVNRLLSIPCAALERAAAADRDYAWQELHAFYFSWLYALPGTVLNRPAPPGLAGRLRHPVEWFALAARASLPFAPYRSDTTQLSQGLAAGSRAMHTVVLAGEVYGPHLPEQIAAGCRRLAELAGLELLGLELELRADGEWRFRGATPLADLTAGGEPLLAALAAAFKAVAPTP